MLELGILLLLIAINGAFSLSELAVVSARKSRLKKWVEDGRRGAAAALALAEDPGRFLSTVQIGITLVGIVSGAYSGATLGHQLRDILISRGFSLTVADSVGYGAVIGLITYLSVVIGELLPKNLALRNAETIACRMAPTMSVISRIASPLVWLLDSSTRFLFWLVGASTQPENTITDEEIKTLVAEAQTSGVIERHEQQMISAVLRLGDRTARAVMTPRTEVEWLDLTGSRDEIWGRLIVASHSWLPVGEASTDNLYGVIAVREAVSASLASNSFDVEVHIRQAPIVPDSADALDVLDILRKAEAPIVLVHDEYGHFEGIVTPADILDAIAGSFRSDEGVGEKEFVQRADGSWLLAGWMPVDEMAEMLGVALPERRNYETVAGLIIDELNRIPELGETVDIIDWRFEIVDLDGRRIDKVLASKLTTKS
jgi:putative hemolysin